MERNKTFVELEELLSSCIETVDRMMHRRPARRPLRPDTGGKKMKCYILKSQHEENRANMRKWYPAVEVTEEDFAQDGAEEDK